MHLPSGNDAVFYSDRCASWQLARYLSWQDDNVSDSCSVKYFFNGCITSSIWIPRVFGFDNRKVNSGEFSKSPRALVLSHYRCPPLCLMGISSITAFQRSITVWVGRGSYLALTQMKRFPFLLFANSNIKQIKRAIWTNPFILRLWVRNRLFCSAFVHPDNDQYLALYR